MVETALSTCANPAFVAIAQLGVQVVATVAFRAPSSLVSMLGEFKAELWVIKIATCSLSAVFAGLVEVELTDGFGVCTAI